MPATAIILAAKPAIKWGLKLAIALLIAIPLLSIAFICATAFVPTALIFGNQSADGKDIRSTIAKYVKLQDEIYDYAEAVAKQKAESIKNDLQEQEPKPESTLSSSLFPTMPAEPTPAPVTYTYNLKICVSVTPWRIIMALDSLHIGHGDIYYKKRDLSYIKKFIISHLYYETDYDKEEKDNQVIYTIYVDTTSDSIDQMARGIKIENDNKSMDATDRTSVANNYYQFLTYYDDDGVQLLAPYFDLGADILINDPIVAQPGCIALPYFNQGDRRWNYTSSGMPIYVFPPDRTVSSSGCGPTSMSMVIVGLTGNHSVNPLTCMDFAIQHGQYKGDGTYESFFASIGSEYGIKVAYWTPTVERIIKALESMHPVICHMGKAGSAFPNGHFLVLRGITEDGKILMYDPGRKSNNTVEWNIGTLILSAKGSFMECSLKEDITTP